MNADRFEAITRQYGQLRMPSSGIFVWIGIWKLIRPEARPPLKRVCPFTT